MIRRVVASVVMLFGLTVLVPAAAAQTCAGAPAITNARPTQGGVGVAFSDNVFGVGARFAGGTESVFGGITIARATLDESGESLSSVNLGVDAGVQISVTPDKRAMFCPIVGISRSFGPNNIFDSGVDASQWQVGGGGTVGFMVGNTGSVRVIPTIGLQVLRSSVTLKLDAESESFSDTSGALSFGLGVLMNDRFSLLPTVTIPFSVEDGKATFGLSLLYSFGK